MKTVVWKVGSKDLNVASFRYRCLMPFQWMNVIDNEAKHIVADNSDILILDHFVKAIIFVKSFSENDLALATKAHQLKIPIYIDICDNFFYRFKEGKHVADFEREALSRAYRIFPQMAGMASLIITTGTELKDIIQENFPTLKDKIAIVPDGIETKEDLKFFNYYNSHKKEFQPKLKFSVLSKILKHLHRKDFYLFIYRRMRNKLKRYLYPMGIKSSPYNQSIFLSELIENFKNNPTKKILWFGNAGIPYLYGVTDILLIQEDLLALNTIFPIELIVCTNNKQIYNQYIAPLPLKSEFVKWEVETTEKLISISDVVIIPNPQNDFTRGKSSNRALLALAQGKPVVASETQAFKELAPLIKLEDWKRNIEQILSDPNKFAEEWKKEWPKLQKKFSSYNIAESWKRIIN